MPAIYAAMINAAIVDIPPDMTITMHLCRGNNLIGWLTEGGHDPVAEMLFNRINVDSYFLEYDTARAGTFEPLRFVPQTKSVVLGLVSSKRTELESKEEIKRRIDEAAKYCELDQMALSAQCGFCKHCTGQQTYARSTVRQVRAGRRGCRRGVEIGLGFGRMTIYPERT